MENTSTAPLRLDSGYSNNWKPSVQPTAILNEASTLHERVAYCWGLAAHLHELSSLLHEHQSSDIARVSGLFYDQITPLVDMLDRLGDDTRKAELIEASKIGGAA
ncbi:hypothetical protein [Polaromonas naphthalenivorans]|uniref:Uncharacterized protein n=1 Tax=Polaromonas naphthalenivorans (strain CJ2) TaxID=365044 RepID=A1VKV4_POLNA|nr:hypothetical protein [Polaromonas naphthalenivorans]ABM36282.1 hypothetical protein Pnap_0965 [Polaromonas naphthalenivorans CJ2]